MIGVEKAAAALLYSYIIVGMHVRGGGNVSVSEC